MGASSSIIQAAVDDLTIDQLIIDVVAEYL